MGRWIMQNTYNSDRLLISMGQKGEQNKRIDEIENDLCPIPGIDLYFSG
jgi:hypothetical protein